MLSFFGVILILFLPLIFSIMALVKIKHLQAQLAELKMSLDTIRTKETSDTISEQSQPEEKEETTQVAPDPWQALDAVPAGEAQLSTFATTHDTSGQKLHVSTEKTPSVASAFKQQLIKNLKQHWLIWTGGIALLIGIAYLMEVISEYIEFKPVMRITGAFIVSCCVILLGEKIHRKEVTHSRIGFAYVPAVISAAGCMGLYSTVIFGYLLYDFLPPAMSLMMMGGISVFTLSLYLRFGPLMAIFGIVAGFTAPLWFLGGDAHPFALSGYISLIALAGLLLASHIRRAWLFPLTLVPYYLWLLAISQAVSSDNLAFWSVIFLPVAMYFILVVPTMGWTFSHDYLKPVDDKTYHFTFATAAVTVLILLVIKDISGLNGRIASGALSLMLAWYPMINARKPSKNFLAPTLGGMVAALYTISTLFPYELSEGALLTLMMGLFGLLLLRSAVQYYYRDTDPYLALLLLAAPVVLTFTGWFFTRFYAPDYLYVWSGYCLLVIAAYFWKAPRFHKLRDQIYACLHLIFAIVLAINFRGSDLTGLFAAQTLLVAWQVKQHRYPPALWVIKVLISLILIRFTLSMAFPSILNGVLGHGGYLLLFAAIIVILLTAYQFVVPVCESLSRWIEGAMAHLFVITLVAQTHYWLITPDQPWYHFDGTHAVVYLCETLAVSAAYQFRSRSAVSAQWLYQRYAEGLFIAAWLIIVLLNTGYSPLLSELVSGQDMPVINKLALGWLIPGVLLIGMHKSALLPKFVTNFAADVVGFGLMALWVIFSIRQYWQTGSLQLYVETSMPEQISYSVAGVTIGALVTLYGVFRNKHNANMSGLSILALIAVKVVLIDTAELEGLFKALSYLFLGSVLVALGWMFQKLRSTRARKRESTNL